MNSLSAVPVLYLDSSYSRHLNREGLFIAAEAQMRDEALHHVDYSVVDKENGN